MSKLHVVSSSGDGKLTSQHGRTDGRTDEELPTSSDQAAVLNAHTRVQRFADEVTVGDVIAAGELWQSTERHPRVRIGERQPISSVVRSAVWYRDGGKCRPCLGNYPERPLQLDHIKPWSAGGADATDNLRLLCDVHNQQRSNFIDYAKPARAATWWCSNCYRPDQKWDYWAFPYVTCPTHGPWYSENAIRCRVARRYWQAWKADGSRPGWHEVGVMEAFDTVAYCAHCDAPGMTGRPL